MVKPPHLVMMEAKQDGEQPTAEQVRFHEAVEACTQPPESYIVRPKDWEMICHRVQGTR